MRQDFYHFVYDVLLISLMQSSMFSGFKTGYRSIDNVVMLLDNLALYS